MIVPRSRLLQWVAAVVLPFALLAAARPETLPLAVGAIGLLLALALLDAVLAQDSLKGLRVEVADLVRLSKDRAADLEVRIRNAPGKARQIRLGLALPSAFDCAKEALLASLPQGQELSRLPWPCTPLQRGRFYLNRAYLESDSPLGFWGTRRVLPLQTELRVYPNLLQERKQVSALFLNRGTFGLHTQRRMGKGRQFEGLRDYVPGDSFDEIHWKATAKRGRPVTKVFQIERTQEVYVIIDTSRLSARSAGSPHRPPAPELSAPPGTPGADGTRAALSQVTVLERFLTSALIVGLAAERQGDLFGLVTFSDRVQQFVRAKNGREHYDHCREALFTLQPDIVTPDFGELASFLRLRLRRRALLIFLTALDDPVLAESFVHSIQLLTRQHLLLVNMVQPPGARPLFSDPAVRSLDTLYEQLGGHLLWHDLRELGKVLERLGVRLSLLEDESMSAQLVTQYLSVKQRQML